MQEHRFFNATVAKGEATSSAIELHQFSSALFHLPAAFNGTNAPLAIVGSTALAGTYAVVRDSVNAAIEQTATTSSWHAFNSSLFGMKYIKLVSDSTQSAARTITISGHGPS